MKNINYKSISKIIFAIILIILTTIMLVYIILLKEYKSDSLEVMKDIAESDGIIENESCVFAVKIDEKDNILDIINNNEFGVERDIYRIIGTDKESGIGYIKKLPIRFFKKEKNYGEIIIFHNRNSEVNSIKLALLSTFYVLVLSSIVVIFICIIYRKIYIK